MKELESLLEMLESDSKKVKEEYGKLDYHDNPPRYANLNGQMNVLNKYIGWVNRLITNANK